MLLFPLTALHIRNRIRISCKSITLQRIILILFSLLLTESFLSAQNSNVELVGQLGGWYNAVGVDGNLACFGEEAYLTVLDVSNTAKPLARSKILLADTIQDIEIVGTIAYVALGSAGVQIVDISFPTAPQLRGSFNTSGFAQRLMIQGNLLFVADGVSGLVILDVSNSVSPSLISVYDTTGETKGFVLSGSHIYIADGPAGLLILDVSNPMALNFVGSFDTPGDARDVDRSFGMAYVADGDSGLEIIDVSNPANPFLRGSYSNDIPIHQVILSGLIAIVSSGSGYGNLIVRALDVSDPEHTYALPQYFYMTNQPVQIKLAMDRIWVADGGSSFFSVAFGGYSFGTKQTYDRFVGVKKITIAKNYGYAIYYGFHTLGLASDQNPIRLGLKNISNSNLMEIPWIKDQLGYVTRQLDGIAVFGVSDPYTPEFLTSNSYNPYVPPAVSFDTPGSARDVVVTSSKAYVADGFAGLSIYDIAFPPNAYLKSTTLLPGGAFGIAVSEPLVYVAGGIAGVQILDATDPVNPILLGSVDSPDFAQRIKLAGSVACVADRASGLQLVNIANPAAPMILGAYNTPGSAVDLSIFGNLVYVADSGSGLSVVDMTDPTSPSLGGYYETTGTASGVDAKGLIAYVADDSEGLLVLRYKGANQPPFDHAQLDHFEIPAKLAVGQSVPISIWMRNAGNLDWPGDGTYSLAFTTGTCELASPLAVPLISAAPVAPEASHLFPATLDAGAMTSGTCALEFQMKDPFGTPFGQSVFLAVTIVSAEDDAEFFEATLPPTLQTGKSLVFDATFKNAGTTAWYAGSGHALGVIDDSCSLLGGATRLEIPAGETVLPGEVFEFQVVATAPAAPASCSLQVQMVRGDDSPFGDSAILSLEVLEPPNATLNWTLYN